MKPFARAILHLDLDAFFAAVEQRDDPALRGRPVIVGGLTARGVVATASYEARKFGVRSAMPTAIARRRCPEGIFLRPRIERYREISAAVMEILSQDSRVVEQVSIDEAYVDVTGEAPDTVAAGALAESLKRQILERCGLTCSAGVAPCKFVAKVASDMRKPDGLVVVAPEEVVSFLAPLPVSVIPGVGKVTEARLRQLGVGLIAELAEVPRQTLAREFGKFGPALYDFARGVDERPIVTERQAKSLGSEHTFETDQTDLGVLLDALRGHAEKVAERLHEQGLAARTAEVKVRYGDFKQISRSESLGSPTQSAADLIEAATRLLAKTAASRRPVRLIGFYGADLEPAAALDFFGAPLGGGDVR